MKSRHIFELHAEFCKMIANPKRLMIISLLSKREMSVGELMAELEVSLSNVSQHLRILKSRHIVKSRKDAQTVYYSLSDKRINDVGEKIRKILLDGLKKRGDMARGLK